MNFVEAYSGGQVDIYPLLQCMVNFHIEKLEIRVNVLSLESKLIYLNDHIKTNRVLIKGLCE